MANVNRDVLICVLSPLLGYTLEPFSERDTYASY